MNDKEIIEKALDTVTAEERRKPEDEQEFFSPLFDERVEKMIVKLARQDEQKRIIRIIEKEKNSIEKNYLLGEKWDEGAKYVVWVLTCLLKEIEGGERGSVTKKRTSDACDEVLDRGTTPAKSRKERDRK